MKKDIPMGLLNIKRTERLKRFQIEALQQLAETGQRFTLSAVMGVLPNTTLMDLLSPINMPIGHKDSPVMVRSIMAPPAHADLEGEDRDFVCRWAQRWLADGEVDKVL